MTDQPSADVTEQSSNGLIPGLALSELQFWIDHSSLDELHAFRNGKAEENLLAEIELCMSSLLALPLVDSFPQNHGTQPTAPKDVDQATSSGISPRFCHCRLLGVGAFGIVFRARDKRLNREVAVKFLRPSAHLSAIKRVRFELEGESMARCGSDGVVPVFEIGEADGLPYIVSGLIDGPNLSEALKQRTSPLPSDVAAKLISEIASTVHLAHQRGILHRDLKPSNVLLQKILDDSGQTPKNNAFPFRPYVTDFGLAKEIGTNTSGQISEQSVDSPIIGSVRYMSPEQALGRIDISVKSDVYSLGVMLFELLTLQCPHGGASKLEVLHNIAYETPLRPTQLNRSVPSSLEMIILKCLSKTPTDRYQSAADLANDLQNWIHNKPISIKPLGPIHETILWAKRNPPLAFSLAFIFIALSTSTLLISFLYRSNLVLVGVISESAARSEKAKELLWQGYKELLGAAENDLREVPQSGTMKLQLHLRALKLSEEIARICDFDEASRYKLSIAHHYVANWANNTHQTELTIEHRKKCIDLVQQLSIEHPENADYHFDLFMNRLLLLGNDDIELALLARENLNRAISLRPSNFEYRDAHSALSRQIAGMLRDSNRPASRELLLSTIAKSKSVADSRPGVFRYWKHYIMANSELANLERHDLNYFRAKELSSIAITCLDSDFSEINNMTDWLYVRVCARYIHALLLAEMDDPDIQRAAQDFANDSIRLQARDKGFEEQRLKQAIILTSLARYEIKQGNHHVANEKLALAKQTVNGFAPSLPRHMAEMESVSKEIEDLIEICKASPM